MKSSTLRWIMGGLGIIFLLSSLGITFREYQSCQSKPLEFPAGSTIADIPVDGLDLSLAESRLMEIYSLPVILHVNDSTIQADPKSLGFSLNIATMLEAAQAQLENQGFWDCLWKKDLKSSIEVPLSANFDENILQNYLETEIEPRYTQVSSPVSPIPGTTNLEPAKPGTKIDLGSAITDITKALSSPRDREVTLQIIESTPTSTDPEVYKAFLKHNLNLTGFDGLTEIYLQSLEDNFSLHFAVQNGKEITPGIAFTAASTIKIPIMVSVLRRIPEPTPDNVINLFERMIVYSENPPADTLMEEYLDEIRGPLIVSEDLKALGFENTFLAGYFYLGAPVLKIFKTPANTRTDIFLDPDIYNQTVPAEAGRLLEAIYTCAVDGSGLLTETFPNEISPTECQLMMDILKANRIGLLIEAGLPPEASTAHKHGWVQELDGLLHSMSDVAIVSTPGGDYIFNIFIYHPERLDFDEGNKLIARLSQTVYNFFNLENQAYWWFD